MNKPFVCVFLCIALCTAALSAAPAAPAPAKPSSGAFDVRCLFIRAGAGMTIPLADAADVLASGADAQALIGWQTPLGPGRLKVGLDMGCLIELTQELPGLDQYTSMMFPLGLAAGYDLRIAGGFYAYAEAEAGWGPTLVFYTLSSLRDLGVFTFSTAGGLGLGLDLGAFSFQAGARIFFIFYDTSTYIGLVPGIRAEIRFPPVTRKK